MQAMFFVEENIIVKTKNQYYIIDSSWVNFKRHQWKNITYFLIIFGETIKFDLKYLKTSE